MSTNAFIILILACLVIGFLAGLFHEPWLSIWWGKARALMKLVAGFLTGHLPWKTRLGDQFEDWLNGLPTRWQNTFVVAYALVVLGLAVACVTMGADKVAELAVAWRYR